MKNRAPTAMGQRPVGVIVETRRAASLPDCHVIFLAQFRKQFQSFLGKVIGLVSAFGRIRIEHLNIPVFHRWNKITFAEIILSF